MLEYIIILFTFGILIVLRIYLFRKSYKRNLNFYSDPDDFVPEMIQNVNEKSKLNPTFRRDFLNIENQSGIANLSLQKLASESITFYPFFNIIIQNLNL